MTEKMKADFLAMGLRSQLRKVIEVHSPSETMVVYMQVVGTFSLKPSTDFFKIWANRKERT